MEWKITKKNSLIIFSISFVAFPIIIGAVLYYLFCPNVWFVKLIDTWFGELNRTSIEYDTVPFLKFIRNYLFDFIWAFAMTNAIFIILNNNAKPIRICLTISVILGITMEILQLLGIAEGTFDIWDIVTEGLGSVLGAIVIKNFRGISK